jgi:hypothetical protein
MQFRSLLPELLMGGVGIPPYTATSPIIDTMPVGTFVAREDLTANRTGNQRPDFDYKFAIGLVSGFTLGYAVRAAISFRHHQAAIKRRYLLVPEDHRSPRSSREGEVQPPTAGGDGRKEASDICLDTMVDDLPPLQGAA